MRLIPTASRGPGDPRLGFCEILRTTCLCAGGIAAAARVNIAVDIYSARLSGTDTAGPLNTQPGFSSWNLTTFTVSGTEPVFMEQGTTFQIFGIGSNQSRVRVSGGVGAGDGTSNDDLTQVFLLSSQARRRSRPPEE